MCTLYHLVCLSGALCEILGLAHLLDGALLSIPVPDLAVCPRMSKGLGWGEVFAWAWAHMFICIYLLSILFRDE